MQLNEKQKDIMRSYFSSFIIGSITRYGHVRNANLYVFDCPLSLIDLHDYSFNSFDNEANFLSCFHESCYLEKLYLNLSHEEPLICIDTPIYSVVKQKFYFFFVGKTYFLLDLQEFQDKTEVSPFIIVPKGGEVLIDTEQDIAHFLRLLLKQ